jgi:hypothetical protein
LLAALALAVRNPSPETLAEYEWHQSRVDRLKGREASFAERLDLIKDLEGAGWKQAPLWPRHRRNWLYGGSEWEMPLAEEQLAALLELQGADRDEFYASLVRSWSLSHRDLWGVILQNTADLHRTVGLLACRLAAPGADLSAEYVEWVCEQVVRPTVKRLHCHNLEPECRDDFVMKIAPKTIAKITVETIRSLKAFWLEAARNYCLSLMQKEQRRRKRNESTGKALNRIRELGYCMLGGEADDIRWLAGLERGLTERQRVILHVKWSPHDGGKPLKNPVVARRLGWSVSTVEKEMQAIKRTAGALLRSTPATKQK